MTHPYIAQLAIRDRQSEKLAQANQRRLVRAARAARAARQATRRARQALVPGKILFKAVRG